MVKFCMGHHGRSPSKHQKEVVEIWVRIHPWDQNDELITVQLLFLGLE
jgi:hypothetical protein